MEKLFLVFFVVFVLAFVACGEVTETTTAAPTAGTQSEAAAAEISDTNDDDDTADEYRQDLIAEVVYQEIGTPDVSLAYQQAVAVFDATQVAGLFKVGSVLELYFYVEDSGQTAAIIDYCQVLRSGGSAEALNCVVQYDALAGRDLFAAFAEERQYWRWRVMEK